MVKDTIWEVVKEYAASPYLINNIRNVHPRVVQFTINDQLFFEILSMQIRAKTISFEAWKKKQAMKTERHLENYILILSDKVSKGDLSSVDALSTKQAELVDIPPI